MNEQMTFHLDVFDGPLDLLLHLISKNKVNIYDIPVSLILEQYIAYIEQRKAMDLDVTADFISMAANLLFIKSRMLLPTHDEDEPDPREGLVQALLEYERFKQLSAYLAEKSEIGRDIYTKRPSFIEPDHEYRFTHPAQELILALFEITEKAGRKIPPPVSAFSAIIAREYISVSGKVSEIAKLFLTEKRVKFSSVVACSKNRGELIAYFLAVLELLKDDKVSVLDDNGEYYISLSEKDCAEVFLNGSQGI